MPDQAAADDVKNPGVDDEAEAQQGQPEQEYPGSRSAPACHGLGYPVAENGNPEHDQPHRHAEPGHEDVVA